MAKRKKGANGNGFPVELRALGEAYHDACYALFLKEIETVLDKDPAGRARLLKLVQEFRRTVFDKLGGS
jgi:hypothetical protein